jgi:hypothetical protein
VLNPFRALSLNVDSGRPLPRVEELSALYAAGVTPRYGQVVMIAGRSGTQKSGFAMWLVDQLDLTTLYLAADMAPATASARIASMRTGYTTEMVEKIMELGGPERDEIEEALADSKITFAFGSPITPRNLDQHLDAFVELEDAFPECIVIDNLMDWVDAESDYKAQMSVMQTCTELARYTGATVIILHHASDKSWEASTDPWNPPSRKDIKNGLAEKPGLCLTVALDPYSMRYRVATVKQRTGKCDPSGRTFITLRCEPELTRFHKWAPQTL